MIIVLHTDLINTETQQCIHRNAGGWGGCHLVRALLNKAPNALRTPCDTPKWIASSLTMTGELDNPAVSHRPSWTLSTDATSFIDVGKGRVCITNTQDSAGPALLPPPHWRGKRGSPLPTSEGAAFIWGDIGPDLIGPDISWFCLVCEGTLPDVCVGFFAFTWVQPRFLHQKSWCVAMMSLSVGGGGVNADFAKNLGTVMVLLLPQCGWCSAAPATVFWILLESVVEPDKCLMTWSWSEYQDFLSYTTHISPDASHLKVITRSEMGAFLCACSQWWEIVSYQY